MASEMQVERIERGVSELEDVTLVNRLVQQSDGRTLYDALPITLAFARNELGKMGDLELHSRQRLQHFNEQMELQAGEINRFQGEFQKFGIDTPNEKRAAILCRRAESEVFSGNVEGAELLFRQARDLSPNSAYVLAKSASYSLARNRLGEALECIGEACRKANNLTGALCYGIKARILGIQRDRMGQIQALVQALEYEPENTILRHQYGVALSKVGQEGEATQQFTRIIEAEEGRIPPRPSLIMALTTRIINLRRIGRNEEAQSDLARAKELIRQYPFLASAAERLPDLEADVPM